MTRILFLDIDGVLNSDAMQSKHGGPFMVRLNESGAWNGETGGGFMPDQGSRPRIFREHTEVLEAILQRTGAVVVFSTSWVQPRVGIPADDLSGWLKAHGVDSLVVHQDACTPRNVAKLSMHGGTRRSAEIRAWLEAHPDVTEWCAVDDLSMHELGPRFVPTEETYGLTPAHVDMVVNAFAVSEAA